MRGVVLLGLVACTTGEAAAPIARARIAAQAPEPALPVGYDPVDITVAPVASGYGFDGLAGSTVVAFRAGALRMLGTVGEAPPGTLGLQGRVVRIDANDRVVARLTGAAIDVRPDGSPITPAALAALRAPGCATPSCGVIAVLVDRDTPARELLPVAAALAGRCWGFVAETRSPDGSPELVVHLPAPCPAIVASHELARVGLFGGSDGITLGLSRVGDAEVFTDRGRLAAALADRKASALLDERVDLSVAAHPDATIAEIVELLDLAHRAGFHAARWVPAAALPIALGSGVGSDPEPGTWQPVRSAIAGAPAIERGIGVACRAGDRPHVDIEAAIRTAAVGLRICAVDPLTLPTTDVAMLFDISGRVANLGRDDCVLNALRRVRFPVDVTAATCRIVLDKPRPRRGRRNRLRD